MLTKHRPEQEGGARGSAGVSWLPSPLPCTPTSSDELRAAGAAVADNSKLLPPLLGRQWVTLSLNSRRDQQSPTLLPPLSRATLLLLLGPELGCLFINYPQGQLPTAAVLGTTNRCFLGWSFFGVRI